MPVQMVFFCPVLVAVECVKPLRIQSPFQGGGVKPRWSLVYILVSEMDGWVDRLIYG